MHTENFYPLSKGTDYSASEFRSFTKAVRSNVTFFITLQIFGNKAHKINKINSLPQ